MLKHLPNCLTIARIAVVPFLIFCFYINTAEDILKAFYTFSIACILDFLDGYIARSVNFTSKLGALLDPIADKLLVSVVMFLMTWRGFFNVYDIIAVIVILYREMLVAEVRVLKNIRVSTLAKWKTFLQMIALCGFFLSSVNELILCNSLSGNIILIVSRFLLWLAAFVSIITIVMYFSRQRIN
jgi:cardiolipin synthase